MQRGECIGESLQSAARGMYWGVITVGSERSVLGSRYCGQREECVGESLLWAARGVCWGVFTVGSEGSAFVTVKANTPGRRPHLVVYTLLLK